MPISWHEDQRKQITIMAPNLPHIVRRIRYDENTVTAILMSRLLNSLIEQVEVVIVAFVAHPAEERHFTLTSIVAAKVANCICAYKLTYRPSSRSLCHLHTPDANNRCPNWSRHPQSHWTTIELQANFFPSRYVIVS
jgi:hypothetical protein